ncbi:MAG: ice-binding family protein [Desulfuromonadaceae bacterium]|nr:ice-binding family protein [Desulfuromonadaceae bacterium]
MKKCIATKAYLTGMVVLGVLTAGSFAFAGSDKHSSGHSGGGTKPPIVSKIVDLGAASTFGVFGGGAGMTNQGIYTVIKGDIGTTGASTLITGFHDSKAVYTETTMNKGKVTGVVYTATAPRGSAPGVKAAAVALASQKAFDALSPAALPGGIDVSTLGGGAGELGGRYLAPGIYKSAPGSFGITGGDLTLDGRGDPNATFVFQMATTLTVGGPGAAFPQSVYLINGAQAKNVFWQVGSAATINAAGGGSMVGTIIAFSGASFSTAGNTTLTALEGRALALHASVTMVNTVVTVPAP